MTQQSPPAGWYPDPAGGLRWWDGAAWTDQRYAAPAAQASSPGPAAQGGTLTATAAAATTGRHSAAASASVASTQPRSKGTGLYREFSPRTTGVLMLTVGIPMLGWRFWTLVQPGDGPRYGLGFVLWTAAAVGLVGGGLNRLSASRPRSADVGPSREEDPLPFGAIAPAQPVGAVTTGTPGSTAAASTSPAFEASPWQQPATSDGALTRSYTGSTATAKRSGYVGVGSRGWVLAVLGLVALLLVAYGVLASRSSTGQSTAAPAAAPRATSSAKAVVDERWAPKGWKQLPGGVAWKKAPTASKDCKVETACVRIAVMTKAPCQMLRLEVAVGDRAHTQIDSAVVYAKKVKAKKAVVVRASTANVDSAEYWAVDSLRCMDIT